MTIFVNVKCAWCKDVFSARKADRDRGWARCCSKSCAAKKREYGSKFKKRPLKFGPSPEGWDGHK